MTDMWICPACSRQFTRKGQRHVCGTGDSESVLRDRPAVLVELYAALDHFVTTLGPVERVARERYVLLRSRRVFADVIVMRDALRLAIHLDGPTDHALFIKRVSDGTRFTVVAKLRSLDELDAMRPFLAQAYEQSVA